MTAHPPPRPITGGLTLLFAVAGGAAVGNLYWAQPLLDLIAGDLHAPTARAGWLVTATQIGYAAGVLLIVPLGDVLDRRRLIPAMMLCSAIALVACAGAPSIGVLLAAISLLGLTTVSGQILTPLAGDLADESNRGRVVGTVVSGILIGILVSRTISGLVAGAAGWRAIYLLAAFAALLFAVVLYRVIPPLPAKTRMAYPALIASVAAVVARERTVRWTLVIGAVAGSTGGAPMPSASDSPRTGAVPAGPINVDAHREGRTSDARSCRGRRHPAVDDAGHPLDPPGGARRVRRLVARRAAGR